MTEHAIQKPDYIGICVNPEEAVFRWPYTVEAWHEDD